MGNMKRKVITRSISSSSSSHKKKDYDDEVHFSSSSNNNNKNKKNKISIMERNNNTNSKAASTANIDNNTTSIKEDADTIDLTQDNAIKIENSSVSMSGHKIETDPLSEIKRKADLFEIYKKKYEDAKRSGDEREMKFYSKIIENITNLE